MSKKQRYAQRWEKRGEGLPRKTADYVPTSCYDDSAATMAAYHRGIILKLAELYSGKELEKRLRELRFCSYKTAREVIQNADPKDTKG